MNTLLYKTIEALDLNTLSEERKNILDLLVVFIQEKKTAQALVKLHFICTHNSRRSHFSQIWAQAMAAYHKVPHVLCYSGGTEATALYPMIIKTLAAQVLTFTLSLRAKTPSMLFTIRKGPYRS